MRQNERMFGYVLSRARSARDVPAERFGGSGRARCLIHAPPCGAGAKLGRYRDGVLAVSSETQRHSMRRNAPLGARGPVSRRARLSRDRTLRTYEVLRSRTSLIGVQAKGVVLADRARVIFDV